MAIIKRNVYILKVYMHKRWVIMGVYDLKVKAQKIASEWDKDVSITEWPVL